jgi:hypothetical protein
MAGGEHEFAARHLAPFSIRLTPPHWRGPAFATAVIAGLDRRFIDRKTLVAKRMDTRVKPEYNAQPNRNTLRSLAEVAFRRHQPAAARSPIEGYTLIGIFI